MNTEANTDDTRVTSMRQRLGAMVVRGVGAIGPARAAIFIHLMPAFGALLSVAFLGEAFYLYHALGIAGILAGVGLSTRGR